MTTASQAQRDALFNVLLAIAHNNPHIGYCQVNINFLLISTSCYCISHLLTYCFL